MKPIQFILIFMVIVIATVYFRRFRPVLLNRVIMLLFGVIGTIMVLMPDVTNALANLVGVGSGAHLLIYLGLLSLTYFCLLLYSRLRNMESYFTDFLRSSAIEKARIPPHE